MLLKILHFRDGDSYSRFPIYNFILSRIDVKTDEIYPLMIEKTRRRIDFSVYVITIKIDKRIEFFDSSDYSEIFSSLALLIYELEFYNKIQKKGFTIIDEAGSNEVPFLKTKFNVLKNEKEYVSIF